MSPVTAPCHETDSTPLGAKEVENKQTPTGKLYNQSSVNHPCLARFAACVPSYSFRWFSLVFFLILRITPFQPGAFSFVLISPALSAPIIISLFFLYSKVMSYSHSPTVSQYLFSSSSVTQCSLFLLSMHSYSLPPPPFYHIRMHY